MKKRNTSFRRASTNPTIALEAARSPRSLRPEPASERASLCSRGASKGSRSTAAIIARQRVTDDSRAETASSIGVNRRAEATPTT